MVFHFSDFKAQAAAHTHTHTHSTLLVTQAYTTHALMSADSGSEAQTLAHIQHTCEYTQKPGVRCDSRGKMLDPASDIWGFNGCPLNRKK